MPQSPAEDHRQTWRGSGKILVVDDEATVLVVAQRSLEHLGFEVLLAENGKQAIQVFKENADEIQVVLLDLTMPHMGGEETFDALRRIRPDVPVVLSSGYPEERAKAGFRAETSPLCSKAHDQHAGGRDSNPVHLIRTGCPTAGYAPRPVTIGRTL